MQAAPAHGCGGGKGPKATGEAAAIGASGWRYGFSAYASADSEAFCQKCLTLLGRGFGAMEVFAIGDAVSGEFFSRYTQAIERVRTQSAARLSVHLPTTDCNPLSRNRRVRRGAIDSQRAGLEWAAAIGAELAVLHLGSAPPRPASVAGVGAAQHFGPSWDVAREVLAELAGYAAGLGVALSVENLIGPAEVAADPGHLLELLDGPGMAGVGITVDISHAHLAGWDPAAFLRRTGARVRHIHANDTDGQGDRHWPLGRGVIALRPAVATLQALGFGGTWLFEVDAPVDVLVANRALVEGLVPGD